MFPKKDFLRVIFSIFFVFLICFITPLLFKFFEPVVFGFIISLILYPLSSHLEKKVKFLNNKWSLSLVVISLLGILIFICILLGSFVGGEIIELYNNLPTIIADTQGVLYEIVDYITIHLPNISSETVLKDMLPSSENILTTVSNISGSIVDFGKNLPTAIINFIFTLLFSFFFTLEFPKVINFLKKFFPENIWDSITSVLKNVIGGYFLAQVKLLSIMFVVIFIGFLIMKMNYAFLLALFVALLDLLPFFGTGTFLGPFGIFCFFKGEYNLVIGAAIIYSITFVIRRVLEPKLLGDSIGVSAFFSLICMFIGYKLMGLLGFILGVPVGVIISNLIKSDVFKPFIESIQNIMNYFKYFISE